MVVGHEWSKDAWKVLVSWPAIGMCTWCGDGGVMPLRFEKSQPPKKKLEASDHRGKNKIKMSE